MATWGSYLSSMVKKKVEDPVAIPATTSTTVTAAADLTLKDTDDAVLLQSSNLKNSNDVKSEAAPKGAELDQAIPGGAKKLYDVKIPEPEPELKPVPQSNASRIAKMFGYGSSKPSANPAPNDPPPEASVAAGSSSSLEIMPNSVLPSSITSVGSPIPTTAATKPLYSIQAENSANTVNLEKSSTTRTTINLSTPVTPANMLTSSISTPLISNANSVISTTATAISDSANIINPAFTERREIPQKVSEIPSFLKPSAPVSTLSPSESFQLLMKKKQNLETATSPAIPEMQANLVTATNVSTERSIANFPTAPSTPANMQNLSAIGSPFRSPNLQLPGSNANLANLTTVENSSIQIAGINQSNVLTPPLRVGQSNTADASTKDTAVATQQKSRVGSWLPWPSKSNQKIENLPTPEVPSTLVETPVTNIQFSVNTPLNYEQTEKDLLIVNQSPALSSTLLTPTQSDSPPTKISSISLLSGFSPMRSDVNSSSMEGPPQSRISSLIANIRSNQPEYQRPQLSPSGSLMSSSSTNFTRSSGGSFSTSRRSVDTNRTSMASLRLQENIEFDEKSNETRKQRLDAENETRQKFTAYMQSIEQMRIEREDMEMERQKMLDEQEAIERNETALKEKEEQMRMFVEDVERERLREEAEELERLRLQELEQIRLQELERIEKERQEALRRENEEMVRIEQERQETLRRESEERARTEQEKQEELQREKEERERIEQLAFEKTLMQAEVNKQIRAAELELKREEELQRKISKKRKSNEIKSKTPDTKETGGSNPTILDYASEIEAERLRFEEEEEARERGLQPSRRGTGDETIYDESFYDDYLDEEIERNENFTEEQSLATPQPSKESFLSEQDRREEQKLERQRNEQASLLRQEEAERRRYANEQAERYRQESDNSRRTQEDQINKPPTQSPNNNSSSIAPPSMNQSPRIPSQMGAQQMNPQRMGPQQMGPQRIGPQQMGPQQMGPQRMGQQQMGPQQMGPQRMGPQQMGPRQMGPQQMGPQQMGPQRMGPQQMGPRQMGPQQMGPQQMGPRQMGSPQMGPQRMGPQQMGSPRMGPPQMGPQQMGSPQMGPQRMGPQQMGSPRTGPPQMSSPRMGPPQMGSPRTGPPQMGSPRTGPPQMSSPRTGPPQMGSPRMGPPQMGSPRMGPTQMNQSRPEQQRRDREENTQEQQMSDEEDEVFDKEAEIAKAKEKIRQAFADVEREKNQASNPQANTTVPEPRIQETVAPRPVRNIVRPAGGLPTGPKMRKS
ncbi:BgTH12-01840 [Blumeria graminis f. sp. triticale]|nr:BgTH12-01840 [Blumeria graminis f. sp. triticale]